jgi:perosamine synthetase
MRPNKRIPLCEPDIGRLEIERVTEAIKAHKVSSGAPPVKIFEEAFAEKFGIRCAIAVNSGGSALFLALKGLGIGPGDEVILPDFTMIATALAVTHCGAKPIFADAGKDGPNIDPAEIKKKITSRTKAILVAHLFGLPCGMAPIMRIARRCNLPVVEDVAEAIGATYEGKLAGTFGIAGCFSFYASKTMTTGEGGMIITNNKQLAKLIQRLREYDIDPRRPYVHELTAWNMRMSSLEAVLGLAQLNRLDSLIKKRNKIAVYYANKLKNISSAKFFTTPKSSVPSVWLYTILAPERDRLIKFLAKNGIEVKGVFVPMHMLPLYKQKGSFQNAEHLGKYGISLPSAPSMSKNEQDYVIEKIKEFYGE